MYSFTTVLYIGSSPNERRIKTAPHFARTGPTIGMLRFSPAMMCGSERPSRKKSQEMAAQHRKVCTLALGAGVNRREGRSFRKTRRTQVILEVALSVRSHLTSGAPRLTYNMRLVTRQNQQGLLLCCCHLGDLFEPGVLRHADLQPLVVHPYKQVVHEGLWGNTSRVRQGLPTERRLKGSRNVPRNHGGI